MRVTIHATGVTHLRLELETIWTFADGTGLFSSLSGAAVFSHFKVHGNILLVDCLSPFPLVGPDWTLAIGIASDQPKIVFRECTAQPNGRVTVAAATDPARTVSWVPVNGVPFPVVL